MKHTKQCPKCGSREIIRVEGNAGAYGSGNNIMIGATIFSAVKVHRYLCGTCGYSEEWIDPEDIPAVKNSRKATIHYNKEKCSMEENGTYSWTPNQPPKKPKKTLNVKKITSLATTVILVIVVLVFAGTCFYTVDDKQQAVVTTFGRVTDVTDAGVHFMAPFGIQQVRKVDVNVYQKIELGYSSNGNYYEVNNSESTMITGDYNIVDVDFFIEYKISDPVQYLYSSNDPELILRNLIQSQVRNVVGSSSVDAVLTDGKESIQMQVKELVTKILLDYDIGLTLVDVKIQDAEPPTRDVMEAFKAVETAKQQAETVINDAKAYQNAQLPQAQAQADKLIQNAEYLRQKRVNEAIEQVAMFQAMYEEYKLNPDITRSRMYYEAISNVFPGVKLFINTGTGSSSDVQMLLPLDTLAEVNEGGTN